MKYYELRAFLAVFLWFFTTFATWILKKEDILLHGCCWRCSCPCWFSRPHTSIPIPIHQCRNVRNVSITCHTTATSPKPKLASTIAFYASWFSSHFCWAQWFFPSSRCICAMSDYSTQRSRLCFVPCSGTSLAHLLLFESQSSPEFSCVSNKRNQ